MLVDDWKRAEVTAIYSTKDRMIGVTIDQSVVSAVCFGITDKRLYDIPGGQ